MSRAFLLLLLVPLPVMGSNSTASGDRGEELRKVLTAYLRAWKDQDWPKVVGLSHPEALDRFKQQYSLALKNFEPERDPFLALFLVREKEAERLLDGEACELFLKYLRTFGGFELANELFRDSKLLGVVCEIDDVACVNFGRRSEPPRSLTAAVSPILLKKDGQQWKVLSLPKDIPVMAAHQRRHAEWYRQLWQFPRKLPPPILDPPKIPGDIGGAGPDESLHRTAAAFYLFMLYSEPRPRCKVSPGEAPAFAVEPVSNDVVSLAGLASDLKPSDVPRAGHNRHDAEAFSKLAGVPLTVTLGISSSGLGTYQGTRRAPLHFASVVDKRSGKATKLYVLLASDGDFIHRSGVAWGGDHLPGVRLAGRMHDRKRTEGSYDRITAELHVILPAREGAQFVFVGYDSAGKQIPAFGRRPFAEHVAGLNPRK
jgi:hypothetical protein